MGDRAKWIGGNSMQARDHVKELRTWRCRYCGNPPANNKQGQWGRACSGCKGSLTRMLRSGKYGRTYTKATKERLLGMVKDHLTGKWVDDADVEWYMRSDLPGIGSHPGKAGLHHWDDAEAEWWMRARVICT